MRLLQHADLKLHPASNYMKTVLLYAWIFTSAFSNMDFHFEFLFLFLSGIFIFLSPQKSISNLFELD